MDLSWKAKSAMAAAGLKLLKASGWYEGYWNHWRGSLFDDAQRDGLHVLPVHYYSPIPDTRTLGAQWPEPIHGSGLDLKLGEGLALVSELTSPYREAMASIPTSDPGDPHRFYLGNPAYHPGEAEVLYGMIRHQRPGRIIEIGCGYSSLLIAQALRDAYAADGNYSCKYTCVEPYRPEYLKPAPEGVDEFVEQPLQDVPLERFESLEAGDILFIDSSHVVRIGSDVVHEYLEILPRLKPGVIVHIHDIFLPYEYPRHWIEEGRFFWNEQYLLKALLVLNSSFETTIALHALYRDRRDELQALIPSLATSTHAPSAFWMKRR